MTAPIEKAPNDPPPNADPQDSIPPADCKKIASALFRTQDILDAAIQDVRPRITALFITNEEQVLESTLTRFLDTLRTNYDLTDAAAGWVADAVRSGRMDDLKDFVDRQQNGLAADDAKQNLEQMLVTFNGLTSSLQAARNLIDVLDRRGNIDEVDSAIADLWENPNAKGFAINQDPGVLDVLDQISESTKALTALQAADDKCTGGGSPAGNGGATPSPIPDNGPDGPEKPRGPKPHPGIDSPNEPTPAEPATPATPAPGTGNEDTPGSKGGPTPDGLTPGGPTPGGPTPDGPTPDGPTPSGPTPDGSTPDGPTPGGDGGFAPGDGGPGGPIPDGPIPGGPTPGGPIPGGPIPGGDGGYPGGTGSVGCGCACPPAPGPASILHTPDIPAGEVYWVCGGVYLDGTGENGDAYVETGTPADCGVSMPTGEALPDASAVDYAGRIVVINPEETGLPVSFTLDDQQLEMQPAEMVDFTSDATLVRFDRGGDFGLAEYTLRPGSYRFAVSENGWELYRMTFEATLDNTASAQDFNLMQGEEPFTVPAASMLDLQSDYPIVVTFENGAGEAISKELADEQTYTIGIDSVSGHWDLFWGNAQESGAASVADASAAGYPDASANAGSPPSPPDDPGARGSNSGNSGPLPTELVTGQ